MEKPRMLEESSTIPSRCRMGKSWDQEVGVRPAARCHVRQMLWEGSGGQRGWRGTHHGGEDVLVKR